MFAYSIAGSLNLFPEIDRKRYLLQAIAYIFDEYDCSHAEKGKCPLLFATSFLSTNSKKM